MLKENFPFVLCGPEGLINGKLHQFPELGDWEPVPQVAALEVRLADVWSKPFMPQGEAGS